jgi:hypothetical protein
VIVVTSNKQFFSYIMARTSFFLLAIVLSVLLRYTDSDYPFGIFKLFLHSMRWRYSLCTAKSKGENKTTVTISGAGTVYPSGAHEFTINFLVEFMLLDF